MGRNKIKIEKIANDRNRQVTFYKRKRGLIKKAMEISLLCDVKVMLCIVDKNEKVVLFSSEELKGFLKDYVEGPMENNNYLTTESYAKIFKKGKRNAKKDSDDLNLDDSSKRSNTRIPIYMKVDRGEGKNKKSKFFKNEEKTEKNISFLIEDVVENNENNFDDILEHIDNMEDNENSMLINLQNESMCSKVNSIFSPPSVNEKSINLTKGSVNKKTKSNATLSETCNDSLNSSLGSINTKKRASRPSSFKISMESGTNSVTDSPLLTKRELSRKNDDSVRSTSTHIKIENPLLIFSKNQPMMQINNPPQNVNYNMSNFNPQTSNQTPTQAFGVNANHMSSLNFLQNFQQGTSPQTYHQNIQNYPNNNYDSINMDYLRLLAQIGGNQTYPQNNPNLLSDNNNQNLFMNIKRERSMEEDLKNSILNYESYLQLLKNNILYSNADQTNTLNLNFSGDMSFNQAKFNYGNK